MNVPLTRWVVAAVVEQDGFWGGRSFMHIQRVDAVDEAHAEEQGRRCASERARQRGWRDVEIDLIAIKATGRDEVILTHAAFMAALEEAAGIRATTPPRDTPGATKREDG